MFIGYQLAHVFFGHLQKIIVLKRKVLFIDLRNLYAIQFPFLALLLVLLNRVLILWLEQIICKDVQLHICQSFDLYGLYHQILEVSSEVVALMGHEYDVDLLLEQLLEE